jgi:N-carbamoyl-L-amino-acid hydrolase
MPASNIAINGARLLADLYRLREFGTFKTGVHRPTYSEADIASRHWIAERMREAGLDATIDGIGNVIGRAPGPAAKLLLGSHSETQNEAGWLDGALGVIYGIEVARTLAEQGRAGAIDVASWADEEGHYLSFPGSRSFIGELTEAEIDTAKNRYVGKPLREVLAEAGLAGLPRIRCDPARYRGYIEAHIEQGDDLEARALKIGVVTSIVGIWQYRITVEGIQNHAGTTRMAIRKDAGAALVKLITAIEAAFRKACAERTVWTVGRITLYPGAASIIPGGADASFQFRDADPEVLNRLEATLKSLVEAANTAGPCKVTLHTISRSTPTKSDPALMAALDRAAEQHAPALWQRMPSGAGHDAQYLAKTMPSAMLFVPSIGGISHHWSENTSDEDITLGCQVLAAACADLLSQ